VPCKKYRKWNVWAFIKAEDRLLSKTLFYDWHRVSKERTKMMMPVQVSPQHSGVKPEKKGLTFSNALYSQDW
jgi:hypothetical protein